MASNWLWLNSDFCWITSATLSWHLRCMWSGLHLTASTSFISCGLFGPHCLLMMPECWLTPSLPIASIIAAASYTRPLPFTFVLLAGAECCCTSVKKRIWDSITPTICDNINWFLLRRHVDFKICLPGSATDKNSWLQSTNLFSCWSISMKQSATRN